MATPHNVIDSHRNREQIIKAILSGIPLRAVAKLAGVSHVAVKRYKDSKLDPALLTAKKIMAIESQEELLEKQQEALATNVLTDKVREVIASAPYLARLHKHNKTLDRCVDAAEKGEQYREVASLIGVDIKAMELGARLEKVLDGPATNNNTQINISIPSQATQDAASVSVIDITPDGPQRGPRGTS